jgi:hypothetical protein
MVLKKNTPFNRLIRVTGRYGEGWAAIHTRPNPEGKLLKVRGDLDSGLIGTERQNIYLQEVSVACHRG